MCQQHYQIVWFCVRIVWLCSYAHVGVQRVGYLALMLLVDETHETLLMVTNSMKLDLACWHDPWVLINALTALANLASASMACDLAADVERLAEGTALKANNVTGAAAGHARKKALLAAARMASRAPELADMFKVLPAAAIQDGNHAVVMASARPRLCAHEL
jgi:AP-1 complex subunit gamma-1